MRSKLSIALLLGIGQTILCIEVGNRAASDATIGQSFVDESSWADEPLPAKEDAEIARLLKIYDVPEPWDHY